MKEECGEDFISTGTNTSARGQGRRGFVKVNEKVAAWRWGIDDGV